MAANPLVELSAPDQEINDDDYNEEKEETAPSSCGTCLWGFYSRAVCRRNMGTGSRSYLLQQQQQQGEVVAKENWLVERVKKVRELSEVLAGPKWKNFIRSLGTSCSGIYKKRRVQMQFHYDPQSYALNFDDRIDRDQVERSRFAFAAASIGMNKGNIGRAPNGF